MVIPTRLLLLCNEAIQLWIDTAREFGDPVPEPKGSFDAGLPLASFAFDESDPLNNS